jgi:hypothetical protein
VSHDTEKGGWTVIDMKTDLKEEVLFEKWKVEAIGVLRGS